MSRSTPRGLSKWHACPTVVGASPTRAEITAGVNITNSIAGINGFSLTSTTVPVPDLGSEFDKTVGGVDSAGDSSLNLWDEIARGAGTTDAARDALAKGTELCLVKMPYGDVPTKRCEVWRVTSLGVNDQNDMSAAMQYQVAFSIREVPNQDGVIPAAT